MTDDEKPTGPQTTDKSDAPDTKGPGQRAGQREPRGDDDKTAPTHYTDWASI